MPEAQGPETVSPLVQDVEQSLADLPRAITLAREALAKGVVHPLLLNLRAYWLESQGRNREALGDLQAAHSLAPKDAMVLNALGLCLAKLERPFEAANAFEEAAALKPNFASAHFNHGWASEAAGELAAAARSFETAFRLEPRAEPLGRLAWLATRRAAWRDARDFATRALAMDERQTHAIFSLVSADIAEKSFASAGARLARVLEEPALPPPYRALAHGLMGDALDGEGRYREAFASYVAANAELKRIHGPQFPESASAAHALNWLKDWFRTSPPWPRDSLRRVSPVAAHVFLVGFPRSGTTLLEQVLASHPDVVSMEEKEALSDATRAFMTEPAGMVRLAGLGDPELSRYRDLYWKRVREFGIEPDGKVFLDKLPFNAVKLPLIAKLFPEAKILVAMRDPRDAVLSCFRRRFRINAFMYELLTLEGAARFYDLFMHLMGLYWAKLPLNLKSVRHEDLVADFERETRAICAFLGIAWTQSLSGFAERAKERPVATPSATQVAAGLSREGLAQWRNYA